jgi:hypothetical protein
MIAGLQGTGLQGMEQLSVRRRTGAVQVPHVIMPSSVVSLLQSGPASRQTTADLSGPVIATPQQGLRGDCQFCLSPDLTCLMPHACVCQAFFVTHTLLTHPCLPHAPAFVLTARVAVQR